MDLESLIMSSLKDDLAWRGLIFQETDGAGIDAYLKGGSPKVYCGFDPTADSLHVGNLVPLLTLRRCQQAGVIPIGLVGGATGLIGDPSGRTTERGLQTADIVEDWTQRIRKQLEIFLDFSGPHAAKVVNNLTWTRELSAIEFLRDVGKHFTVNWMLGKESVKSRLSRDEGGISYTEFSYMILQAFDFYHLAKNEGCLLQFGGSDQWGNITAGIELIGKKLSKQAYGLTHPLVTTTSGVKFGKSVSGAIWLDPKKTSPYAFYQYWLNTEDADAVRFLKYFTFLDSNELTSLETNLAQSPEQRNAQKRLAAEVTKLVHGRAAYDAAVGASEALFGSGDLRAVDDDTLQSIAQSAPTTLFGDVSQVPALGGLLVATGLCPSKSQATQMISGGGVYLNNERMSDPHFKVTSDHCLHGKWILLRRGKKNYAIVKIEKSS